MDDLGVPLFLETSIYIKGISRFESQNHQQPKPRVELMDVFSEKARIGRAVFFHLKNSTGKNRERRDSCYQTLEVEKSLLKKINETISLQGNDFLK